MIVGWPIQAAALVIGWVYLWRPGHAKDFVEFAEFIKTSPIGERERSNGSQDRDDLEFLKLSKNYVRIQK